MTKPRALSAVSYGRKDIFQKRREQGYTEAAFGSGEWVGNQRIVRLWVFYHPNGEIATFEHPKFSEGSQTVRGKPFEKGYTEEKFREHEKECKLTIGPKINLGEILNQWEE